jgi:capsular exopolysaccharide synthesis family protein
MPEALALARREAGLRSSAGLVLDTEAQELDSFAYLRTYWNIVNKHRWKALSVAFVVALLATIASFKMTPIYEATVRLDVEADSPQIQSINDFFRQIPTDEAFLGTQIQVLEGVSLAERTIEELGLTQDQNSVRAIQQGNVWTGSKLPSATDDLVGPFMHALHVQKVRESHVVNVGFESADPQLSAKVANALASAYIEYNFRQKYDATRQASGWMEQQLDELKAKVEKSQQALVDYERQNAIVNLNDKESVVEQRMADLSRELTNAQNDRVQKESVYELVSSNPSQVVFVTQNELLQHLEEKYADLRSQYVDVLQQAGPKHPRAERLQSQLNEMDLLIQGERKRIVERIRNDYLTALGRERLLAAAVAKEKVEVGVLNQLLIQHSLLKRESETNQQLYDNLLQKLKDATVSAGLRATNVHIIDPARPPKSPTRPKKLLNIFAGLMVGLALGLAVAFVTEAVDTSIKSVDEAEQLAGAPALTIIPRFRDAARRQTVAAGGNQLPPKGAQALALLNQPSSAVAESFRTLLTSVVLSTAPQPPQAILLTSSTAGEGKTVTAVNLAIALAQRGEPTLLIDADLRHPSVGRALDLASGAGLASVLTGAHRLEDALRPFPPVPTLCVLPAGPRPPNPAQLLASSAMEAMLAELRKRFKCVVIDSPPVLPVTDAMILSTYVDGVVFVIESGRTVRGAVSRTRKILQNVGAKVVGIVYNKVDLRHGEYYGSYGHYYYNYHADDREPARIQ